MNNGVTIVNNTLGITVCIGCNLCSATYIDCLTVKRSNQGGACGVAMDIDAVAAGCVVVLAGLGCSGLMTWRCAGGVLEFMC